jgi:flagellar hook-length control protein FliK
MAALPGPGESPFSRAGPMVADTAPPPLQSMLQILQAGGSFAPLRGKPLPSAGMPTAVAGRSADGGPLTALAALVASQDTPPSGVTPTAQATLAPLPPTAQATLPAAWLRSLLTGERATPNDELLPAVGDAITAGDSPVAQGGANRAASPTTTLVLPTTPTQQPAFEQALGERLAWLVQEGRHDARIKLHPAELGSLDIRLSMDGEATRVSLASPHAAVRDALEQALPRLREILGHAGLELSQVDIGAGDARSHGDFGRGTSPSVAGPGFAAVPGEAEPVALHVAIRLPQGLVDTFA